MSTRIPATDRPITAMYVQAYATGYYYFESMADSESYVISEALIQP